MNASSFPLLVDYPDSLSPYLLALLGSKICYYTTHAFIACEGRTPRAIIPLVVKCAISTCNKYIQAIWSPCNNLWRRCTHTTHVFIACEGRTPRGTIPPLVVKCHVGSDDKRI